MHVRWLHQSTRWLAGMMMMGCFQSSSEAPATVDGEVLRTDAGTDEAVTDPVESIIAFRRALDDQRRQQRERCGVPFNDQHSTRSVRVTPEEAYRALTEDVLIPRIRVLVAEHGMTLDEEAAAECLAFERGCESAEDHSACRRAYSGGFEVGDFCLAQHDCAPELECRFQDWGCGVCAVPNPLELGESCEAPHACGAGLECVSGLDSSGQCVPIAGPGERCDRYSHLDDGCPDFHECIGETCVPFTAFEVVGPGGHCYNWNETHNGLVANRCDNGLRCMSNRCVSADLDIDEPCSDRGTANLTRTCRPNLLCHPDTGRCAPAVPIGGRCEDEDECISRYCSDGICTRLLQESGSPCRDGRDCMSFTCIDGACAPQAGRCEQDAALGSL